MRIGNSLPKHEVQRLGLNVWEHSKQTFDFSRRTSAIGQDDT
jgi:hypothetical protein